MVCPVSSNRATTVAPTSWSSRRSSRNVKFSRPPRELPNAVVPVVLRIVGPLRDGVDDRVLGVERDHAFGSALGEAGESSPDDLHVLLRHRPPSIPAAAKGARPDTRQRSGPRASCPARRWAKSHHSRFAWIPALGRDLDLCKQAEAAVGRLHAEAPPMESVCRREPGGAEGRVRLGWWPSLRPRRRRRSGRCSTLSAACRCG